MKLRLLTGFIYLLLFIISLYEGLWLFTTFVVFFALRSYFELIRMSKNKTLSLESFIGYGLLLLILSPIVLNLFGNINLLTELILYMRNYLDEPILISVMFFLVLMVATKNKAHIEKVSVLLFGIFYIGYGFFYFAEARIMHSFEFMLGILIMIWITDSGAYLFGRQFGKRKLYPSISPNKTVEGALGGVLSSIIVGLILYLTISDFTVLGITKIMILSIIVSFLAQFGDLIESAIKRHYDTKDSGRLLPGHGGALDRFDSIIFVFPMLHLLGFI